MRKSRFPSASLTLVLLIAIFLWLQHKQDKRANPNLQELTQAAEAGTVVAEDHFSPTEDLERIDAVRLQRAKTSVDVAMYAFTDRYLAEQLKEVAGRGVKVRIYRDQEQYEEEQRKASKREDGSAVALLTGQPNIEIRVKGHRELMHLKAYLIDGTMLRDGSANWSPSGEKRQDNNAHYTADPTQVDAFRREFEQMWSRRDNVVVQ